VLPDDRSGLRVQERNGDGQSPWNLYGRVMVRRSGAEVLQDRSHEFWHDTPPGPKG
jgi:hypothetical protein